MGLRVGLGLELGLSCGNGYLTSIGPNTKHSGPSHMITLTLTLKPITLTLTLKPITLTLTLTLANYQISVHYLD